MTDVRLTPAQMRLLTRLRQGEIIQLEVLQHSGRPHEITAWTGRDHRKVREGVIEKLIALKLVKVNVTPHSPVAWTEQLALTTDTTAVQG